MVAGWVLVPAILCFIRLVRSVPVDFFPLNSQLPPVARISQPFSFIFSPSTFSSPFPIIYSLANAPGWLSIDSQSRRLFGTPTEEDVPPGDVVGIHFELVAEDQQGSLVVNATLVVSRGLSPTVRIPIKDQIARFGPHSAPSALLVSPSRNFKFAFASNTFALVRGSSLTYYAITADNTPLPSWLQFDANNLSFSGITPPFQSPVQPSQTFAVQLVASDVLGFAAVSIAFSIVVGNHKLTADAPIIRLNATRGSLLQYNDLSRNIKLDSGPVSPEQIQSITAYGLPDWLTFNSRTWALTGSPDAVAESTNVTIAVTDIFENRLNITLAVGVATGIFRLDPPPLNVSGGEQISVDLKPCLWKPSDVELKVAPQPQAAWIRFDPLAMVLSGTVPNMTTPLEYKLTINGKSKSINITESRGLAVRINARTDSSSTTTIPNAIPSDSPPASTEDSTPSFNKALLWILLPIILACIASVFFLVCLRRRRRAPKRKTIGEVSPPIPGSFVRHTPSSGELGGLHDMFDVGAMYPSDSAEAGHAFAPTSKMRISKVFLNPDDNENSDLPTTITKSRNKKPSSNVTVQEIRGHRLRDLPAYFLSERRVQPGVVSPLFDASVPEDENQATLHGWHATSPRNEPTRSTPFFGSPITPEGTSTQYTPNIAYTPGSSHGFEVELNARYPASFGATEQPSGHSRPQVASSRLSNVWRRGSPRRLLETYKRKSNNGTSVAQTPPTIILTRVPTEQTASEDIIQRPTVLHVPNQPGEMPRASRRADESSPLFGGRAVVRYPSDFDVMSNALPPPSNDAVPKSLPGLFELAAEPPSSDNSWDRFARDTLGIAHKDLVKRGYWDHVVPAARSGAPAPSAQRDDQWNDDDREYKHLMSPDRWSRPRTGELVGSSAIRAPQHFTTTLPAAPTTPKSNSRSKASARGLPRTPKSPPTDPPSTTRRKQQISRDERQRLSCVREQQALQDFKSMISKTPSPEEGPRSLTRPLPPTPTRKPLADRLNDSRGIGTRGEVLRESHRNMGGGLGGDDDCWEDIRLESRPGGDGTRGSNGYFSVYV